MGLVAKLAKTAFVGGAATIGTFFVATRKNIFVPMDPTTAPLFTIKQSQLFNPNKNPTMHDDCMRSVPLNQIKPELLEKEGELVKAFCAGVWSGRAYDVQRVYLKRKYYGPDTKDQLWEPKELKESSYPVGTQITDHFEVVEHNPSSIVVRCGDTPRIRDVRPGEGVFEMAVDVKPEQGVAEFHLRSVFWQGQGKADKPPMEGFTAWLHKEYTKMWMESALFNVSK